MLIQPLWRVNNIGLLEGELKYFLRFKEIRLLEKPYD